MEFGRYDQNVQCMLEHAIYHLLLQQGSHPPWQVMLCTSRGQSQSHRKEVLVNSPSFSASDLVFLLVWLHPSLLKHVERLLTGCRS